VVFSLREGKGGEGACYTINLSRNNTKGLPLRTKQMNTQRGEKQNKNKLVRQEIKNLTLNSKKKKNETASRKCLKKKVK
jgi:hypothetical protein